MKAKVTYFKNRQVAYVSGSRLAVLSQVQKLHERGFQNRDNEAVSGSSNNAHSWQIKSPASQETGLQ